MNNNDLFDRVFDKLDSYEARLNTTCNTMTEIKTTLELFIESVNKKELETKQNLEKRYRNITVVFGSITTVSVLIGITKAFGVF